MAIPSSLVEEKSKLTVQIGTLLQNLGTNKVDGVVYDTAWVARLASRYPNRGFEASLEWLRRHQFPDGSWGAALNHYHDRYISTLAALVALSEGGNDPRDKRRLKRGEDALWQIVGRLGIDDSDTVGFPILSTSLAREATALGLDVPIPPIRFAQGYQKKVDALLNATQRNWRVNPLTFSFEGLSAMAQEGDHILEENNIISTSPAATAGYLLRFYDENALGRLTNLLGQENSGAIPAFACIDVYEIGWGLNYLRLSGAIEPTQPEVQKLLKYLWELWSPEHGIPYSRYFGVPDLDDTAMCFALLRWGGYSVNADVFSYYELEDHFCCYRGETNLSTCAHIRLLAALQGCKDHPNYERWLEKIIGVLRRSDQNGVFWWDKWHASPYYVSVTAVSALQGIADDLARSRVKWILRTQRDDGGWGYLGQSTPEETACCLLALLIWDQAVERVNPAILKEAAEYLLPHAQDKNFTPLWISKGLYTPHSLVQATIASALFRYMS